MFLVTSQLNILCFLLLATCITSEKLNGNTDVSDKELLETLGIFEDSTKRKRCENELFTCVPYYRCKIPDIVSNGASIISIRFGNNDKQSPDAPSDSLKHSDCTDFLDVCCSNPQSEKQVKSNEVTIRNQIPVASHCGQRKPSGIDVRISGFNDNEAQFGEFPWVAAILRHDRVYICVGALISDTYVVTAAHCVKHMPAGNLTVRLGEWDTQRETERFPHVDVGVSKVIIHHNYNPFSLIYDVALLRLSRPVQLQSHINTICLPKLNENFDFSTCVVAGWGKDRYHNGSYQTVLKRVHLIRDRHNDCTNKLRKKLGPKFTLHESLTCAQDGYIKTDESGHSHLHADANQLVQDACTGDGGSPLACENADGVYVHTGIVAYGVGCAEPNVPGVYADLTYLVDWVKANI